LKHLCTQTLAEIHDLPSLKDKEIVIGGMVTEAQEKFTKNNKPYGTMILEDFSDTYNLRLFSKDYMNFKQYFTKGYNLLIKGRVQEREWGDTHELELKVKNIQMLAEAKDDMIQNLIISMELPDLSENFVKNFEKLAGKNKGKIMLKFYIYDPGENLKLEMFSRNQKISLSEEMIDFLENSPEIQFKVS